MVRSCARGTRLSTMSYHAGGIGSFRRRGCCEESPRSNRDRRTYPPTKRSEEHTSELQSQSNLVCRLLLEKKKKKRNNDKQTGTVDEPSANRIRAVTLDSHSD